MLGVSRLFSHHPQVPANTSKMSSPSPHTLDSLFPAPSRFPPSPLSPTTLAGHTDDSIQTLRSLLKHNHESHHIFFNYRRFHNHVTHHLLAIHALGADSSLLKAAYDVDKSYQRPAFPSPGPITAENFVDHLGEEDYYQAYLTFFSTCLLEKGVTKTLEEYIYSKKANYDDQRGKEGKKQPEMFSRLLSGLLHPLIHLGYGLEFGLVGMVAEGLAQTAVHVAHMSSITPPSYWDDERHAAAISSLVSRVSSLALNYAPQIYDVSPSHSSKADELTTFNILALMQKDDSLTSTALGINNESMVYQALDKSNGSIRKKANFQASFKSLLTHHVNRYSDMWSLNIIGSPNVEKEVQRKIEELAWTCAIIYGLGGWSSKDQSFRAHFTFMHLVTSSLFLPSIAAYFPPHAIQVLLRTYFSEALGFWVVKGRPTLRMDKGFIDSTSVSPQEPIKSPHNPAKDTLTPDVVTPNPWLAITQSVLQHPDDHMSKIQRALMHWANMFGSRPAGYWVGGKEQLEGIELLDGTFFVRIAGLTADKLGWMREGQEKSDWYFDMF